MSAHCHEQCLEQETTDSPPFVESFVHKAVYAYLCCNTTCFESALLFCAYWVIAYDRLCCMHTESKQREKKQVALKLLFQFCVVAGV